MLIPGIHKKILDIFQPALHIIQAIFAFTAFIKFAGNGNRIKFGRKQVPCIFKCQAHFRKTAGRAGFRAIEHKALKVFAAQVADLLFTDHPANAVNDIAFTATVGANDAGNVLIKIHNGFIGKAFKTLDL